MVSLKRQQRLWVGIILLLLLLTACADQPEETASYTLIKPWIGWIPALEVVGSNASSGQATLLTPTVSPVAVEPLYGTPTPDPLRETPPLRTEAVTHIVQWGESLNSLAIQYQVSPLTITQANGLINPDFLPVGRALYIPPPVPREPGPSIKIIPDSELVNGPAGVTFDLFGEIARQGGYLTVYFEEVEGELRSGAAIVDLVSRRYSVNPRLLLAVLEFQSGWLRSAAPQPEKLVYPIGYSAYSWVGLFSQFVLGS
jgi:LysM repeat protein